MVNRKDEFREAKIRREKKRVNDLMMQVKSNSGQVNTAEIALLWNIPKTRVKEEIQRLTIIYNLPITRMEQGYPTYYFDNYAKFELYDEVVEDEKTSSEQLLYPDPEKTQIESKFCSNCGDQVNNDRFCGNCGYDLMSAK